MPRPSIIKRYPNRKLYDTEARQYITLEGVAALIRQGRELKVVDHASGEDLTAVTLTQIILEQEKKQGGFLPQAVLAGLIRAGGETLTLLRRTLAWPLDLTRQVDEEIERRLQALVGLGELAAEEGERLRARLVGLSPCRPEPFWPDEQALQQALDRYGVAGRKEFQKVLEQLDILAARLDEIASVRGGRSD